MSDEKQAPKRRAGNINRYTTLGNARARERSTAETSEHLDAQAPESLDADTSRSTNVQEQERSDVEELARPDSQEDKRPGARTPNKRERHTIYFPPDLSEWVKIKAIKTKKEMSEIVTEAVERYRQQEEDM